MSPTWSRPCLSIMPPWRILAMTRSSFSTRNVTPWEEGERERWCLSSAAYLHPQFYCSDISTLPQWFIWSPCPQTLPLQQHPHFLVFAHQGLSGLLSDANHAHSIGLHQGVVHRSIICHIRWGRDFVALRGYHVVCLQKTLKEREDGVIYALLFKSIHWVVFAVSALLGLVWPGALG